MRISLVSKAASDERTDCQSHSGTNMFKILRRLWRYQFRMSTVRNGIILIGQSRKEKDLYVARVAQHVTW